MTRMPVEKENILSHLQLFAIITRIILGASLMGVYRSIAEISGRDSWISLLVASIPILIAVFIIITLNKRFPGYTFVEYAGFIVGKWPGKLLGAALPALFIFVAGILLRLLSEMVSTWLLPATPIHITVFFVLFLTAYLSRNGLLVLGRFCTIITLLVIPANLLVFAPAPKWLFSNLQPVGEAGLLSILSGTLPALFAYGGYEALLMLYPYIQNKKKIMRTAMLSLLLPIWVYVTNMIAMILYFGPMEIRFSLFPPLVYLTTAELPIIHRVESIVFMSGLFIMFSSLGSLYTLGCLGFSQLLGQRKRKNMTLWCIPLLFGIAMFPKDIVALVQLYDVIGWLNVAIGMIVPLLLLMLAILLKRRKEGTHADT